MVNLDKDIDFPEAEAKDLSQEERDTIVGLVYKQLMEIESRLLPCGLHVIGKPPTAEEAVATLVSIASIDREEEGIMGLPSLLAQSLDRNIQDIYSNNDKGVLADVELNQKIVEATRECVGGHGG